MNFDQFNAYRDQALLLHASQEGPQQIGLDAIFTAVVAHAASARGKHQRAPVEREPAPQWFLDALERLKGQRVTVSSFLLLSGLAPVTEADRRNVGRWLREAGIEPRKVGGEQLFQL
ncbi:hypothetical protein [Bradyrhizobium yuanmingense]|uniref:hypothetical protein n=1 Tax=Bradyrhizobium yuanmingense TaxID=108015 RepID=UPI0004B72F15|nr:hypothetical protein [Bradyrhizobium yuanmingense]